MNDAMLTELRQIREAIERLTARATTPRWGDITTTAREFGVSPVFLRRCLRDETYPLSAKKVGGKWLVDLSAMHNWVLGYPDAQQKQSEMADYLLREVIDDAS